MYLLGKEPGNHSIVPPSADIAGIHNIPRLDEDGLVPLDEMQRSATAQHETRPTPEIPVAQGLILDFDRTLGDVDNSMKRLFRSAELVSGFDAEEFRTRITDAQAKVEADGGTFEPLSILREQCDSMEISKFNKDAYYNGVVDTFVELGVPPVLYDDAVRFLLMLQAKSVPHVFMTYGVSSEWQKLKIAAAGYPAGVDIMEHSEKGIRIEELRSDKDQRFHFSRTLGGNAEFIAGTVCLVDDKAKSFKDLPEDCRGFLVKRGSSELASQQGEVPENVDVVASLDELVIDDNTGILRRRTEKDPPPMEPDRSKIRYVDVFNCFQMGPWNDTQTLYVDNRHY